MAGNIKGITIEIGGDTTKLDKAIKSVNDAAKDVNKNLKEINRALKFNPGNTELLAQKQRELSKQIENTKDKLDTLKQADKQAKEQLANGDLGQEDYDALQREIIETESKLNHFEGQLEKVSNYKLENLSNQFKELGDKMQEMGTKLKTTGKNLTGKITAPILALGAAATKGSMEFEAGMSNVQAISGATASEMERIREKALELAATSKFTTKDVANGFGFMAMAGWDASKQIAAMPAVIDLATASGEDLAMVSDIVTDSLSAFKWEAEDAGKFADILAAASSNANTNVGMLGESFKYVAPVAATLAYDMEDVATVLGVMANNGIKSSQAGTALRGALSRLAKPTKEVYEGLEYIGLEMDDLDGKGLNETIDVLRDAFKKLTPEAQGTAAAMIFGQNAMSGMASVLNTTEEDYYKLSDAIRNSEGAASDMKKTMQDNLKGSWDSLISSLDSAAVKLGDTLAPALRDAADKITELVDKFTALDPEVKKSIVKFGLLAAALGPVVMVVGSLISSIGTIAKGIGGGIKAFLGLKKAIVGIKAAATTAGGGLVGIKTAISALLGPVGLAVGAVTALGTGAVLLAKHLSKDAIPETQGFGEAVSESTKKAVQGYLNLEKQATVAFNELSWSGQAVTTEMKDNIIGNFQTMSDTIIEKAQEQKTEVLGSIQEMVDGSSTLSEQEKERMVELTNQKYDEQMIAVQEGNQKIKDIMTLASEENRALTEQEKNQINAIKEDMRLAAVTTMSESAAEQKAILEGLKADSSILSAEQAAEVVRNATEQKNKTIEEANAEYNDRLKAAVKLKEDGSAESIALADKIIAEAGRQRDGAIKAAEDTHLKVVEEAQKQASEHVDKVDWETGEVLSKFDVMRNNVHRKMGEIKQNIIDDWEETKTRTSQIWENMNVIVPKLAESIKVAVSNKFNDIKRAAEEKFNGVVDAVSRGMKNALRTVSNFRRQFFSAGSNIIRGIADGIYGGISYVVNAAREAASRALRAAKNFLGIHSPSRVMRDQVGKQIPAGMAIGIEKDASKVDKAMDGVVDNIKSVSIPNLTLPEWRSRGDVFSGVSSYSGTTPVSTITNSNTDRGQSHQNTPTATAPVINIEKMEVRDETDIQKIAKELYRLQKRGGRSVPV